jgi:hypothetical protein
MFSHLLWLFFNLFCVHSRILVFIVLVYGIFFAKQTSCHYVINGSSGDFEKKLIGLLLQTHPLKTYKPVRARAGAASSDTSELFQILLRLLFIDPSQMIPILQHA